MSSSTSITSGSLLSLYQRISMLPVPPVYELDLLCGSGDALLELYTSLKFAIRRWQEEPPQSSVSSNGRKLKRPANTRNGRQRHVWTESVLAVLLRERCLVGRRSRRSQGRCLGSAGIGRCRPSAGARSGRTLAALPRSAVCCSGKWGVPDQERSHGELHRAVSRTVYRLAGWEVPPARA